MRIPLPLVVLLLIGTPLLAQPAAQAAAGAFALGEREKLVFVGDSITAAGHYTVYVEAYLVTRFPERNFRVINSGRSSETLSNLSEVDHPGRRPCLFTRFDAAVAEYAPTMVVSCYGINDGIYHPFSAERLKKYQEGVGQLIAKTRGLKARLLVLTPPVYDGQNAGKPDVRPEETYGYKRPFADYEKVMEKYAAWAVTLKEEGVTVGDLHTLMVEHVKARRQDGGGFRMSRDGIHPSPTGHLLMAMAVLKAWNAPALVDEAVVDAASKKAATGQVQDLDVQPKTVRFTWTSKLPMPREGNWDGKSLAVERFTETLNRHRLTVTGLAEGRYQLFADDAEVGQFTAPELAAGIDLTALDKFPTTARSQKVVPLVKERRKLGTADFRKDFSGKPNPKLAELDERLQTLCKPVKMAIRAVAIQ